MVRGYSRLRTFDISASAITTHRSQRFLSTVHASTLKARIRVSLPCLKFDICAIIVLIQPRYGWVLVFCSSIPGLTVLVVLLDIDLSTFLGAPCNAPSEALSSASSSYCGDFPRLIINFLLLDANRNLKISVLPSVFPARRGRISQILREEGG